MAVMHSSVQLLRMHSSESYVEHVAPSVDKLCLPVCKLITLAHAWERLYAGAGGGAGSAGAC